MTQAAAFVGADELEVERASHPLVARATEAVFAAVAKGLAQSRGPTTTTTTAAAATGVRAGAGAAAGGGASADAGAGAGAGAGADAGGGGGHDNATTAAALEVAEADAGAGAVGPSTHGSSGGGLNQQQRRRIARMVREATTVTVVGSPLGLRLAPLVDTVGAVVAELQPGAAAETAGVEAGSVVVGVGSRRFHPATPYGVVRAAVREGSQAVSRGDVSGVVLALVPSALCLDVVVQVRCLIDAVSHGCVTDSLHAHTQSVESGEPAVLSDSDEAGTTVHPRAPTLDTPRRGEATRQPPAGTSPSPLPPPDHHTFDVVMVGQPFGLHFRSG